MTRAETLRALMDATDRADAWSTLTYIFQSASGAALLVGVALSVVDEVPAWSPWALFGVSVVCIVMGERCQRRMVRAILRALDKEESDG